MDNYEIINHLGKGSFGQVYLAQSSDPNIEDVFAIKIIPKDKLITQINYGRMLRDIDIPRYIKRINRGCHKNVICIVEALESETEIWIVYEFINGPTLNNFQIADEIGDVEAIEVMYTIASTLQYLHSIGIRHRDIKPANIVLNKEKIENLENESIEIIKYNPVLIDFDLACIVDHPKYGCYNRRLGTPNYLPPEIWLNEENIDYTKSDIYSLGVTFYFMLNNRHLPYQANIDQDLKELVLYNEPIPSRYGERDINKMIMRMINKDPEDRPSLDEILEILQNVIERLS